MSCARYLKRFDDVSVARSSVHRILGQHGMGRLPANQKPRPYGKRWLRYEKPQPGHRLQMDVKFLERLPGTRKRLYKFTAIDDCARIRVLRVYDACNQATAIRFADELLRRLPFRVLTIKPTMVRSSSRAFTGISNLATSATSTFAHGRRALNGKVERSHRIDDQEFYQLLDKNGVTDDIYVFNQKLRALEWTDAL